MDSKIVLITGGSSGIGASLAKKMILEGHKVIVCGREEGKFLQHFPGGDRPEFYALDVSKRQETIDLIDLIVSKYGKIDVVVANAGIAYPHKTKIPDFDRSYRMIEINVLGVMNTFEGALKHMLRQKSGHLVGVASVAGFNGMPGTSAYSASKAAVIKYCESLRLDLRSFGVNVTCVCPGFIDTPLTRVNPHPMPFLMSSEESADKIYQAIVKNKAIISFPWQLYVITRVLEIIPRWAFRKIMGIKIFNFSKDHQ